LEGEVEAEDDETMENERVGDEEIDEMRKGMTAREIKDLERDIKPMRLVLTKVNLTLLPRHNLLVSASQGCLRNQKLFDNNSSGVVQNPRPDGH
jgi:hypothetical protein